MKVAVTVVAEPSDSWQAPVPVHRPPDQPVKVEPAAAVAVSVTTVPSPNDHGAGRTAVDARWAARDRSRAVAGP